MGTGAAMGRLKTCCRASVEPLIVGMNMGVDADDDIDHLAQAVRLFMRSLLPGRDRVPVRDGGSAGL
jgi:hypothetical protein